MQKLTDTDLINLWEQGLHQPPVQRAIILLAAVCPDMSPDNLLKLSIGQRDWMLLQLRERLFGSQLINTALCPECEEQVEWENRVGDFLLPTETGESFECQEGEYFFRFRLPNSLDIAALIDAASLDVSSENTQAALLTRCLLQVEYAGKSCTLDELPEDTVHKLLQAIEKKDPMSEIRIRLTCPDCSHDWEVLFDIISFLWTEINDWAVRMLQTVHKLAVGYGWSEQEILALSPVRRQLYLGMLAS